MPACSFLCSSTPGLRCSRSCRSFWARAARSLSTRARSRASFLTGALLQLDRQCRAASRVSTWPPAGHLLQRLGLLDRVLSSCPGGLVCSWSAAGAAAGQAVRECPMVPPQRCSSPGSGRVSSWSFWLQHSLAAWPALHWGPPEPPPPKLGFGGHVPSTCRLGPGGLPGLGPLDLRRSSSPLEREGPPCRADRAAGHRTAGVRESPPG